MDVNFPNGPEKERRMVHGSWKHTRVKFLSTEKRHHSEKQSRCVYRFLFDIGCKERFYQKLRIRTRIRKNASFKKKFRLAEYANQIIIFMKFHRQYSCRLINGYYPISVYTGVWFQRLLSVCRKIERLWILQAFAFLELSIHMSMKIVMRLCRNSFDLLSMTHQAVEETWKN